MSTLDRIKAQGGRTELQRVDVPEWGETPATPLAIYYRKASLNDVAQAVETAKGNPVRQNVELFCIMARNADETRMFKRIDVLELMEHADADILGRVMRQMGVIRTVDHDETEKN